MRSRTPWARVIIVNYDSGGLLQACVDALGRQTLADFEAVIVDNASRDGSIEALRLPDDRFRVEQAGANLGFAAASNLGAQGCQAAWICMLNPDAEPGSAWLEELRGATLRHPGARMFGSTQIDAAHPDRVDGFGDVYSIFGTAWRGASGSPVALAAEGRPRGVRALRGRGTLRPRGVRGGRRVRRDLLLLPRGRRPRLPLAASRRRCVQVRKAELAPCRIGDCRPQQRFLPLAQPAQSDLGDGQEHPLPARLARAGAAACRGPAPSLAAWARQMGGGVQGHARGRKSSTPRLAEPAQGAERADAEQWRGRAPPRLGPAQSPDACAAFSRRGRLKPRSMPDSASAPRRDRRWPGCGHPPSARRGYRACAGAARSATRKPRCPRSPPNPPAADWPSR